MSALRSLQIAVRTVKPRSCVAIASLILLAATARADRYASFTNEPAFTVALAGALTRTNEFGDLEPGSRLHPLVWTNCGLACSIVSDPLLGLYALTGALSTATPATRIVIQFTSGNVRAAGGLVYLTSTNGLPVAGSLEMRVAGGPTFAFTTGASPRSFTGLASTGPLLTNLTLVSLSSNAFVTLDHLVVSEGQPWLNLTPSASSLVQFAWPAPATGYRLESRALPTGSFWTPVSGTAVRTNDFWQLTVPAPGEGALFRLRNP